MSLSEQLLAIGLGKGRGGGGRDRRRLSDRRSGYDRRKQVAGDLSMSRRSGTERREAERRLSDSAPPVGAG
jgi:hypothetical protein